MSHEIKPTFNPVRILERWIGLTLIHVLLEMIKNGFDWHASNVHIWINKTAGHIALLDNGDGMNSKNRNSFCSFGDSSAGVDQEGQFGTGSKGIACSFSRGKVITIVTAPKDDPANVYIFSFNPVNLAEMAAKGQSFLPEIAKKNDKNWPWKKQYGYEFGTHSHYPLDDPKSRTILTAETLARRLSARLPMFLSDPDRKPILIGTGPDDEKPLPLKRIKNGKVFREEAADPTLGTITLELYVLEDKTPEDGFRVGAKSIGEVPFCGGRQSFVEGLGEFGGFVPVVLMAPNLCGQLTFTAFAGFVGEDRKSCKAAIEDFEGIRALLKLLNEWAPRIAQELDIETDATPPTDQEQQAIDDLLKACEDAYGSAVLVEIPPQPPAPPRPRSARSLRLKATPMPPIQVGETVKIKPIFSDALIGKTPADIDWLVVPSAASTVNLTADGLEITPLREENLRVIATVKGMAITEDVHIQVVSKLRLELNVGPHVNLNLEPSGQVELEINIKNIERVYPDAKRRPPFSWSSHGVGKIVANADGTGCKFVSNEPGICEILVHTPDSHHPKVTTTVDIKLKPPQIETLKIRDDVFHLKQAPDAGSERVIAIVTGGGARIHLLYINGLAGDHAKATADNILSKQMRRWVAFSYASWHVMEREDHGDPRDYSPTEVANLTDRIGRLAAEVQQEFDGKKTKMPS